MRNIKRNIREKIMMVAFKVICRLEESIGNVSGNLVSNYDMDKFFVRVAFWIVFALEWVAVNARARLDIIEFNERLRIYEGVKWDRKKKEYVKI